MRFPFRSTAFLLPALFVASACQAQSLFFWKHNTEKSGSAKLVQSPQIDELHTQAVFTLPGKVVGTVDKATAILYDSTDPIHEASVTSLESGANSVENAKAVCSTFVPGHEATIGPGGNVYLDYVERANYTVVVCAPVSFQGMEKPVWTSATIPLTKTDFTASHAESYDIPGRVEISLDPYVKELNAQPSSMMALQIAPATVTEAAQ